MPRDDPGAGAEMFFILGRGRSGTTLLSRLLDAHPAIAVAPESLFVMNLYRRYRRGGWTERRIRAFSRDMWLEERMRRWRLDRAKVEERLLALVGEADFSRLCTEVYAAGAEARGKRGAVLLGDKNPGYSLFGKELAALFRRSRFIHLVRDYRDNVLSFQSVQFDLSSVSALAYRWLYFNRCIAQAARRFPRRFFTLRFEDLINEPRVWLERLCQFLGIPFSSQMLDSSQGREVEARLPWHPHLGSPLDPAQAGKWRTAMSVKDGRRADWVCQPFAAGFGYEPSESDGELGPIAASLGMVWGRLVSVAERLLFRLPVRLRTRIIHGYRIATGNKIS